MNFTIDIDKVNLAENRGLLAQCLEDAPYLSMVDVEFESGDTLRFLKMDKGEFLCGNKNMLSYSTDGFYRLLDDSNRDYEKIVSIYLSKPVQSDVAKKHEKFLYDLTEQYKGWVVGRRFISPDDPGYTQATYFLDAHNNFASVSRLQVALTILGDKAYEDFKKENEE
nr:MAG TPA: hypothetical protein [Caudoviricetes sp.]